MKALYSRNAKESDLPAVVEELKKIIPKKSLVFLEGQVGAGKTSLMKAWSSQATSPTYSLLNRFDNITHGDLYRIKSEEELEYLEIDHYLDSDFIFLEWGLQWGDFLTCFIPRDYSFFHLEIASHSEDEREYKLYRVDYSA